jgi:photosystem II stability/assembly factor-like uncharacterized protein
MTTYAATTTGDVNGLITNTGVFKSTDSGATWSAVNTGLSIPEYAYVSALVIDPITPSTLYVGTNGSGVFRSTDSGATWSAVNTGLSTPFVFALALAPTTASTLYVGSVAGLFSLQEGGPATPSAGGCTLTAAESTRSGWVFALSFVAVILVVRACVGVSAGTSAAFSRARKKVGAKFRCSGGGLCGLSSL